MYYRLTQALSNGKKEKKICGQVYRSQFENRKKV